MMEKEALCELCFQQSSVQGFSNIGMDRAAHLWVYMEQVCVNIFQEYMETCSACVETLEELSDIDKHIQKLQLDQVDKIKSLKEKRIRNSREYVEEVNMTAHHSITPDDTEQDVRDTDTDKSEMDAAPVFDYESNVECVPSGAIVKMEAAPLLDNDSIADCVRIPVMRTPVHFPKISSKLNTKETQPQKKAQIKECTICKLLFGKTTTYLKHMKMHQSRRCEICNLDFHQRTTQRKHMIKYHRGKPNVKLEQNKFDYESAAVKQEEDEEIQETYVCGCDETFDCKSRLIEHFSMIHKGTRQLPCNLCGKYYPKDELSRHRASHDVPDKAPCPTCGLYILRTNLARHQKSLHSTDRPFHCSQCDWTGKLRWSLTKHETTHSMKQHLCTICGKLLASPANLRDHMLLHTGTPKNVCTVCGKNFGRPGNLQTHMLSHTGEKPHACWLCDKRFGHSVSLRSHVKSKHPGASTSKLSSDTKMKD